jgi:HlyD family secretion protein
MKRKTYIIAGSVVVIAAIAAIVLSGMLSGGNGKDPHKTARVTRRDIIVKVTESGEVAPVTVVNVKSEMAGEVKRLFVEEGDSVRAGDRLALVQQESSQAQQIASARASVERAKIDLEDTERDLRRQQDLFERGFVARKDVEDAEQAVRLSQIQYELSEKQLWVALGGTDEEDEPGALGTKAFDTITVTAPISGVVISLDVEQGEMITSGTQAVGSGGTVLMAVADLSKMIVKANVNEVDVGKIKEGLQVQIGFDAIRGQVYTGVVKTIAPAGTLDGNIVVFPIEVEIVGAQAGEFQASSSGARPGPPGAEIFSLLPEDERNALRERIRDLRAQGASIEDIRKVIDKAMEEYGGGPEADRSAIASIKPGMTADLDIIIAQAENVLSVPKEALIEGGRGYTVMVPDGGETVSRPVTVGLEDNVYAEITDGLGEGDEVIINGTRSATLQRMDDRPPGGPPM